MFSVQPNMQVHDDLAALFSRNLNFNPDVAPSAPKQPPQLDPVASAASSQPVVYSVSQHYHHSAHIPKPHVASDDRPRPSSVPPQSESLPSETVLRNHGIDPAILTPSQLQLFRIADTPQQRRLLELWSICPPTKGGDIPSLAWSSTTLEQEEQLARLRYERIQQDQGMSFDGVTTQTGNGQWHQQPEPYMTTGYEELMRRERELQERQMRESQPRDTHGHFGSTFAGGTFYNQATDPVYMGPDFARQQQQMDMASQYGAYEQLRGMGELDVMDAT